MVKRYKSLDLFEKALVGNNGKRVSVWDDGGIVVGSKHYKMFEYGDMDGHSYVTFRYNPKRGFDVFNEPLGDADEFISVEYHLRKGETGSNNIFEFIKLRDDW